MSKWTEPKIETHCELCGDYSIGINTCKCLDCESRGIINKSICNYCLSRLGHYGKK